MEYENAQSLASDSNSSVTDETLEAYEEQIAELEEQIAFYQSVESIFTAGVSSSGTGGASSIEGFPDPFGVGVAFDGEAMLDAMLDAFKLSLIHI